MVTPALLAAASISALLNAVPGATGSPNARVMSSRMPRVAIGGSRWVPNCVRPDGVTKSATGTPL